MFVNVKVNNKLISIPYGAFLKDYAPKGFKVVDDKGKQTLKASKKTTEKEKNSVEKQNLIPENKKDIKPSEDEKIKVISKPTKVDRPDVGVLNELKQQK